MSVFYGIHILRCVGPGGVNRGRNGEQKTITIGRSVRVRHSCYSEKAAIREFFKAKYAAMSKQSRKWVEWIENELTHGKIPAEEAGKWARGIMSKFMGHKEEKEKKAQETGKKPKKAVVVRLFPEEIKQLEDVIQGIIKGEITSVDSIKFTHRGIAYDLASTGRMLPTRIPGAISVGHTFGIDRMSNEMDFFIAQDDMARDSMNDQDDNGAAHLANIDISSNPVYNFSLINRDQVVRNLDGDEKAVIQAMQDHLEAMAMSGASSRSTNGAHTRTLASYILVERTEHMPYSLCDAFFVPASTIDEGIERLRSLRKAQIEGYGLEDSCQEFSIVLKNGKFIRQGSLADLKEFIK